MDANTLIETATGYWKSATLSAAIELGLFDLLSASETTVETAASELKTSAPHTEALLNALAGMGVLRKSNDTYTVEPELAVLLDPSSPDSLIDALRFNIDMYPLWGNLPQSIREGRPVIPPTAHLGGDPERTLRFVKGMHSRALLFAPLLLPALDLGNGKNLLDVAAGPGTFSALLAEKYPKLQVTLFDLPPILDAARSIQSSHPAIHRITFSPGDYHRDPLPGGFDAVLYCGALHQEHRDDAGIILSKLFAAMNPGAVLYLVDLMLEADGTRPVFAALFSINMMLTRPAGHVYTGEDAMRLVQQAGFTGTACIKIESAPYWVIRAVKPTNISVGDDRF